MTSEEIEDKENDLMWVKDACLRLRQKFDTIQVFATRFDDKQKKTVVCFHGDGDWYARFGVISLWVKAEENSSGFNRNENEDAA